MRKLLLKIIAVVIIIYAVITVITQQKALNQYSKNKEELQAQIQEQNDYKQELTAQKDNINSLEFIEKMAREKLDMYLPNEKVYIDQGM